MLASGEHTGACSSHSVSRIKVFGSGLSTRQREAQPQIREDFLEKALLAEGWDKN